ncbi:hypothetical protein Q8W25_17790 [Shimia thalassica]|uniref:hypothetical protein n=1 Tax=Shimia thalassica TaxID=1715693 RepID=UPI0027348092|nr:hypothetical protein [Shimia thalassica]MDP2495885.1 hypothetical protein [Shimia thalassica]
MSNPVKIPEITRFLDAIDAKSGIDLQDAFANEVLEHGGTYPDRKAATKGFCLFELQLHGIYVCGVSEISVITQWADEARAIAHNTPPLRATDGRPDCPYNGQGVA